MGVNRRAILVGASATLGNVLLGGAARASAQVQSDGRLGVWGADSGGAPNEHCDCTLETPDAEDMNFIVGRVREYQTAQSAENLLSALRYLGTVYHGFPVSQLEHGLQAATRARRANGSDEVVLAALCHDVGKVISVKNHDAIAAAMLKPYVSDDVFQVLHTHQTFQGRFYYKFLGKDTEGHKAFSNEPWYNLALKFTGEWDAPAFDPKYKSLKLEDFEPLVRQYVGRF